MSKKITMEDLNLDVSTGTMIYVDIDVFRFLYHEEMFYLTVQIENAGEYEFLKEIDLPENKTIVNHNDLRIVALNWIFGNVEIACTK